MVEFSCTPPLAGVAEQLEQLEQLGFGVCHNWNLWQVSFATIGGLWQRAGPGDDIPDGYPRIMGFVAQKRGKFVANVPSVADCAFGVEHCKWLSDIEKSGIVADSRNFRKCTGAET